jgi:L-ascorbate metabolism protein UlaG (beta-lactamase superfamily)
MFQTRGHKLMWLGHATFRIITASGRVVLIDPWLTSNPACPDRLKKVEKADILLITHGHFDHIADAVDLAKKHKSRVIAMPETCVWLESKGVENTSGMNIGGTQKVGDIEVTMVQAFHSCGIQDGDDLVYGGDPAGFVVRLPGGPTLYHAGDTTVFGDMKLIGELYSPDLALLPIGDHYTMGPREAALAVRLLGVHHVVPMHFGTFPVLTGTPEQFREFTKDISGLEVHVLKPGETIGESAAARG